MQTKLARLGIQTDPYVIVRLLAWGYGHRHCLACPRRHANDNYKWIALSNVTLGVLLAVLDGSIVLIAMPSHLPRHPPRPARAGEQLLPAVDDPRLPRRHERPDRQPRPARGHVRPGEDVQPRLPRLHDRLAVPDDRLDDRARRRAVPDRLSHRAGGRGGLPAGELRGDPDRRLPGQPARDGARHQQHRRRQRRLHRARARRPARADRLAGGVPDLGADRRVRDRLGVSEARGAQHAQTGEGRLVGQPHLRARADPDHGLGHLRHPPLRRPRHRLDEPQGDRSAGRGRGLAWWRSR